MSKIHVLAVFARSDCYATDEYFRLTRGTNKKIMASLKKLLKPYHIRLVDFESDDDTDQLVQALNGPDEADEVILTVDAQAPMHTAFYRLASCFMNSDGRPSPPYLLITNADTEFASRSMAESALREVWLMENPVLHDYSLQYPVIYCSKDFRHFSLDGKSYEGGIEVLVNYLESTHDYWCSRRRN